MAAPVNRPSAAAVHAGQAVYGRLTLAAYDPVVLGLSNRFLWRCPTSRLLRHYRAHLSANHLDVGVGSGYFLDTVPFPEPEPRVALMDLNRAALDFTARRIARYRPEIYRRNVLEPISIDTPAFDSIGLNYLLHCLPGALADKAVAFDHLKTLMQPGATLFGATILGTAKAANPAARALMHLYNRRGIFHNEADTRAVLEAALHARFTSVSVEMVGCVALFSARDA